MKIAVFSTKSYDRQSLERYNAQFGHDPTFFEPRLSPETAALGRGFPGVCIFVNDACDAAVIADLARHGTQLVATRSAATTRSIWRRPGGTAFWWREYRPIRPTRFRNSPWR